MEAGVGASQGQGGSIRVAATGCHQKPSKALSSLSRLGDSEGAIAPRNLSGEPGALTQPFPRYAFCVLVHGSARDSPMH